MKKIILSLAAVSLFMSVDAQKVEMQATQKAYESKDYATALKQAEVAESKLNNDATIEPESIAAFYYAAAKSAKASGDLIKTGEYFAKLNDVESNPYFKVKNKDTKNWEYYYSEKDADKAVLNGKYSKIKSDKISNSLLAPELMTLNNEANAALQKGNDAFNQKDFKVAGDEFVKSYYLYKALGKDKPIYKYYAALGYIQSKKLEEASDILNDLLQSGFTGVETNYIATNQEGKDVAFSTKDDMDTQAKLGLVTNPRVEKTESLQEDLYSNATYTYYQLENYEKAIEVGQKGLELYPKNDNMSKLVSASFQKSGNAEQFIATLQEKVDNRTADAVDYFNLAKSLEDIDANANFDKSKSYYQKAIELDPNFADAYLNLAFLIITPEKQYVEAMNANLGSSAKEKKIYIENRSKRKKLYLEALPYLEKAYALNQDNSSLIKILKNSYEVVGDDAKYTEFKKKYDTLVTK